MPANIETEISAATELILEVGRWLHARNLAAAGDGNISVRLSDGRILITPSGLNKARLRHGDIALLSADGRTVRGHPSSERGLHLVVYRHCHEARAVVHAHPPTAIAWTIAHPGATELPSRAMPEVILSAGAIPVVPYARPGSDALGDLVSEHLPHRRLIALARHGAVSWGETVAEAYDAMERLEHVAMILKAAVDFGGITELPDDEVEALEQMRSRLGQRIL